MFQAEVLQQVTNEFEVGTQVHTVVSSFTETMLEPMIERYSLYPAKGTTEAQFAHNSDQMMLTHVLNGLFPVLTLVYEAQKRKTYRLARLTEEELRVYVLAYSMHDVDKILGDTQKFHTRTKKAVQDAYQKLARELEKLNARAFLSTMDNWLSEILWLAVNTQRSRDINLAHTTFVPPLVTDAIVEACHDETKHSRNESILRDLCTLSDLLAFFVKSPEDALLSQPATRTSGGILSLIRELTNDGDRNSFTLAYHKLAEVRGFLSNQVNNGTIRYLATLYPKEQEQLIPFLYFPNGVVYLNPVQRPDPLIDQERVNELIQAEIRKACLTKIEGGAGLGFDPKGRRAYPGYFHDFLSLRSFLELFAKKTLDDSRINIAENTLAAMRALQNRGAIDADIDLNYSPSRVITQLGRFLINYVDLYQKNLDKSANRLKTEIEQRLITRFGKELWDKAARIPSSGGVDYRYYWLAAQYLGTCPLASYRAESPGASLQELFQECINDLLEIAGTELDSAPDLQGSYLQDLSDYLTKNLIFGFSTETPRTAFPDFAGQLTGYAAAKKQRGSQLSCTICNSAYTTIRQEDASVLFQPWVYKNRLPLYKGENAGGICSICSLELMLRQLLLTDKPGEDGRINLTGTKYEGMELKYFFLYPGFFFTNQTFRLTGYIVSKMSNLKLYEVYKALREKERIQVSDVLQLKFFNLTEKEQESVEINEEGEQAEQEEKSGMYLFDRYEKTQYPGFIFFAKKTFSKKTKTGESVKAATASWLEAAWLGLALPLIIGARVVVTEEYLPLYNSAADFLETVVLDAPHQSLRYLLPQSSARLRLNQLYGQRKHTDEVEEVGGAMTAFSRAIELHIDTERVGGDLKLERFSRIAHDIEDDQLYVFSFLKEQMRRDRLDAMPGKKVAHYDCIYRQFVSYYHFTEGDHMTESTTRHEKVTDLYLQFYLPFNDKGTWPNSYAIVRPIDIAAKCILKDTLNLTDEEIKIEMFQTLKSWLDIVDKKGATGRVIAKGKRLDDLVQQFVETFYDEVFRGYAQGQRSILNSRLNRFKGGCEAAFSLLWAKKRQEKTDSASGEEISTVDDAIPDESSIIP